MVHKVYLDGGSCFSSPSFSMDQSSVYIGTLKGSLFSINVVREITTVLGDCILYNTFPSRILVLFNGVTRVVSQYSHRLLCYLMVT